LQITDLREPQHRSAALRREHVRTGLLLTRQAP
jgi:hypothetical protein